MHVGRSAIFLIDYVIGIAFKTAINFDLIFDKTGTGPSKPTRPYRKFSDLKDFQDYMEEEVGHEIDIESSIDPLINLEMDDKRMRWYVLKISESGQLRNFFCQIHNDR